MQASFPGGNGKLVVSVEGCDRYHRYLAATPWTGGALTPITETCAQADQSGARDIDVTSPDASPDGTLVIARQMDSWYAPEYGSESQFTTVRPDGTDRRLLPFPEGTGFGDDPSFSPRGDRFAFGSGGYDDSAAIWATNLDGSRTWPIRATRDCGPPERTNCVDFLEPRWSPDGKLIATVVRQRGYSLKEGFPVKAGIWLIRARDGKLVRRVAKHGGWVDWSPDGSKLVYGTSYHRAGTRAAGGNLYIVSRKGGHAREFVHREAIAETDPAWSPDGRWISWVSLRFDGGGDVYWRIHASLWRKRVSGGRPQRLATLPSPDVEEAEYNPPELTWLPEPR